MGVLTEAVFIVSHARPFRPFHSSAFSEMMNSIFFYSSKHTFHNIFDFFVYIFKA